MKLLDSLQFGRHELFFSTVARLAVGGAIGGLAALAIRKAFGESYAYEITMGCIGIGIFGGVYWPRRAGAIAVLAPGFGLLGLGLLVATGAEHEIVGLALMGALLGWPLGSALPRLRRAMVLAGCSLGTVLGVVVARAIERAALQKLGIPDLVSYALEGGLMGSFASLGTIGRHLSRRTDPISDMLASAARELPHEFSELTERLRETRSQVLEALGRRDGVEKERIAVRKSVDEISQCLVTVGRTWQGVDSDLGTSSTAILEERIESLGSRIEQCQDEEARRAYEKARTALQDQLQHRVDIARSRERTMARLHSHLAILERLHLAVVRFRSVDAHRFAGEMQPLLDELEGAGTDAELAAQAMDESHSASPQC